MLIWEEWVMSELGFYTLCSGLTLACVGLWVGRSYAAEGSRSDGAEPAPL